MTKVRGSGVLQCVVFCIDIYVSEKHTASTLKVGTSMLQFMLFVNRAEDWHLFALLTNRRARPCEVL
jgi:hypothetical protein